jgi:hypothetical protein
MVGLDHTRRLPAFTLPTEVRKRDDSIVCASESLTLTLLKMRVGGKERDNEHVSLMMRREEFAVVVVWIRYARRLDRGTCKALLTFKFQQRWGRRYVIPKVSFTSTAPP